MQHLAYLFKEINFYPFIDSGSNVFTWCNSTHLISFFFFLEPDVSSEESVSTVEEQENETPPATSSETEQPKGQPENEEKEENKPSEETKKE